VFREISNLKRKSAYVAEQILAAIKCGEYKKGDRLPAERVIAEQMKVSRNCVREALSALQLSSILESKVGAGTYVRNPVDSKVDIERALNLAKDTKDLVEIWEARKEIEIVLIRLAIERATPTDLKKITDHLEEMTTAVSARDQQEYLAANEKFHLSIANSADNLPLRNALQALYSFTNKKLLDNVNTGYVIEGMEKSLREHEDILESIRNGDESGAAEAINAHFRELESYFETKYLGRLEEKIA